MNIKVIKKLLLYCILFISFIQVANAQHNANTKEKKTTTRILFVFDASQSMFGRWQSDMKINIAQKLLISLLDSLKSTPDLELGLRVYGHQKNFPPQDCDDTKLEIPLAKANTEKIKTKLKSLTPRGTTPIALSLEKSADDFPPCPNCRNIIILITDGLEECGGDPCAVSQRLQNKGIVLKPFVIGIGNSEMSKYFDCVGTYFDATSETQFRTALNIVISQALNSTTAQVNLMDKYGKPTETNVNMSFYDNYSHLLKYNYIHTMNNRGFPDTLTIDPLLKYDIVVHTIPPVKKDSVKMIAGKHNIIAIDAPQGYLKLKIAGGKNVSTSNIDCIIRKKGDHKTLNVQMFDQTEKYLIGTYDIEILCMPRLIISDVEVLQNHTTTVEIPQPGIATIQYPTYGVGSLYLVEENVIKWQYNIKDNTQQETLLLQPGKYKLVFRPKVSASSLYTIEKDFTIESGVSIVVKINF